jgi:hypothetical protein
MDHEPSVLLGAVSQQFEIDCSTFITCWVYMKTSFCY